MPEMERKRNKNSFFILLAVLVSQNLLIPVMCINFEDQKHYYSPDPHHHTTPQAPSHKSPSHGTTPSHGGGNCITPSTPTPSHGGGGIHTPTPSTPSDPSSGGGYHTPPRSGSGGSGGYSYPPPTYGGAPSTPVITTPPSAPTVDPSTPTPYVPTPSTPTPYVPTPSTPTPFVPTPSTPTTTPPIPFIPDPNSPPSFTGTCNWWRTHPNVIWGLFGWWGTVGGIFGVTSTPAFGTTMSLPQALANPRTDGIGALYREGTASLLNSLVNKRFPYTTQHVKDSFAAALVSNKAATAQAQLFKLANEGRLKPRA